MTEAEKIKSLERKVERLKFQLEVSRYENEIYSKSLARIEYILQAKNATIG